MCGGGHRGQHRVEARLQCFAAFQGRQGGQREMSSGPPVLRQPTVLGEQSFSVNEKLQPLHFQLTFAMDWCTLEDRPTYQELLESAVVRSKTAFSNVTNFAESKWTQTFSLACQRPSEQPAGLCQGLQLPSGGETEATS